MAQFSGYNASLNALLRSNESTKNSTVVKQASNTSIALESTTSQDNPSSPIHPKAIKTYTIFTTKSLFNYKIHLGSHTEEFSPCIYYVNNSTFTPKTPDVQLRLGDSKEAPIVASAKFWNFSRHVKLALGDGSSSNCGGVFEELHKVSRIAHSEYSLVVSRGGERRKLVWKRSTRKDLCWDYTCVDDESGEVVARFENAGFKGRKCGTFEMFVEEEKEVEWLVLVSWLSIREKETRFAEYSRGVCV